MSNDQKAPITRRIDLSNCKLLSPYGQNIADRLKIDAKAGMIQKIGFLNKPGIIGKPDTVR